MKDVWKELQAQGEGEDEPLFTRQKGQGTSAKANTSTSATGDTSKEEVDILDTGFTLREIGPQAIRFWLGLQVVSLFFQFLLWREVTFHLNEFEEVIAYECAPQNKQHGVCAGPMWNVSAWEEVVLPTHEMRPSHTFTFATTSSPPTFMVVVDPVSMSQRRDDEPAPAPHELSEQVADLHAVRWSIEVTRTSPPQVAQSLHKFQAGQGVMSFEDLSTEAAQTLAERGRVEWHATLHARMPLKRQTRYVFFVEDARTPHLRQVHASAHCTFSRSWQAFNKQHEGHSHRAMSWCRFLLLVFLFAGGGAVYLVNTELEKNKGRWHTVRFHMVVVAKFVLQDVPQQVCMVLYLLGWYEASGLRCQLCLFIPEYCTVGYESALHATNLVALTCTLMSSVSNQLLIRPIFKRSYTEDDYCIQLTVRIGGGCIALLPFTTGICMASSAILPIPNFMHFLAAVPCGIGWLTLGALIFVPVMTFCDEACDD